MSGRRRHGPAGHRRLWGPPVLYAAAIFVLSSIPNPPVPPGATSDKYLHALLYAGLTLLVLRALAAAAKGGVTLRLAASAAALAAAYGVTDELHQAFVPGRVADPLDLFANALGAAAAALVVWAAARWSARAGRRPPLERISEAS